MPFNIYPHHGTSESDLCSHKLHTLFSLRYIITRKLGKGGQGIVFEGLCRNDHRKVAVKFINKNSISPDSWISTSKRERVPKEVYILSKFAHEGMISLLDYFDHKDYIYIVMELFGYEWEDSGTQLDNFNDKIQSQIPLTIKQKSPIDLFEFIERSGRLSERQASHIMKQVVSVIQYLHSNSIIHGDIKDENILIDEKLNIKMIDFGSSKILLNNDRLNRFQGTINYVSPEILRGGYFSGKSNDLWCLGILLYTMLTGQVPFASVNDIRILKRRKLKVGISKEAKDLLDIILVGDPCTRPDAATINSHEWLNKIN